MSIDEAAGATRRCGVEASIRGGFYIVGGQCFAHLEEAKAACDRLNLIAVLEAIREPTKAMVRAATNATGQFDIGHEFVTAWQAMIDTLIAEAKEKQDA